MKEAIKKEITKLLVTEFVKEILHPEWLGNPILVQKKNLAMWSCVLIIQTSTSIVQRIPSIYPALIRLWTQQQAQLYSPFFIVIQAIIKLLSRNKTILT